MRKYLYVLSNALQSLSEYRLSLVLDICGNLISSLVLYLFWRFLAGSGLDTRPYTQITIGIYFLLMATFSTVIGFDALSVAREIKEGDIAQHILRPISYLWMKFYLSLPDRVLKGLVGVVVLIILWAFGLRLNVDLLTILFFLMSLILAILGSFLIYFTVGLLAFWTQQTHGFSALIEIGSSLVSGRYIPIELLPTQLITVSSWLPFRYFLFFPVQILLGMLSSQQIIVGLLAQSAWIVGLYLLTIVVWRAGQKQLEAVGI